MKTTLNITSFLTIGAGFGVSAIAMTLVPLFFGEGYEPTVEIVYILALLPLVISISNVLGGMYYTPSGKKKQSSFYLILGAGINLLLNIPLIILLNAKGAAIASLVAEIIITFLYIKKCNSFLTVKELVSCVWKKIIAGGIMFALVFTFTYFFKNNLNSYLLLLIQVVSGIAIYCLALIALRDRSLIELFLFIKQRRKAKKEVE